MEEQRALEKEVALRIQKDSEEYYRGHAYEEEEEFDVNYLRLSSHS